METQKTATELYCSGLRQIADWFEAHPDIPPPSDPIACYTLDTKEEAARCIRALGSCAKTYNDWSFTLSKNFEGVNLRFIFTRAKVCERRIVGVETVPAEYVPAHTRPATTREIVEWDCGPVLGADDPLPPEVEAENDLAAEPGL